MPTPTRKERTGQYRKMVYTLFKEDMATASQQLIDFNFPNIGDPPAKTDKLYLINVSEEEYILPFYRKYLAAYRIQQMWKSILVDENHPIGRRKINENYDEQFSN